MFKKIQRDVSARISTTWTSSNERIVSEKEISPFLIIKSIITDERLWPIVAFRYKNHFIFGFIFKFILIMIRIIMGVKIGGNIGNGFSIGHASCIFLNNRISVGNDVRINQGTIIAGGEKGFPCVGNNVHISAGVKIIGNITIGNNVHIGANAVVVSDVPDNSTVVGIPASLVRLNNKKVNIPLKEYWENVHLKI